jgi:hypothetical protein
LVTGTETGNRVGVKSRRAWSTHPLVIRGGNCVRRALQNAQRTGRGTGRYLYMIARNSLRVMKIGGLRSTNGGEYKMHTKYYEEWRLLRCYAASLVRTDVSEELSASIITVTRIGEIGTTLAVTSNGRTLRRNTKTSNFTCSWVCYSAIYLKIRVVS